MYNDVTNKSGLIQSCEEWLFGGDYGAISGNANLLLRFTSALNYGVDITGLKILEVDNKWQYDDSNYTDFPEATTNLTNGQQTYTMDTDFMKIAGVECLDSSGNWFNLKPLDEEEIRQKGFSLSEYFETDGQPLFYDVKGNSIVLYPAPATGNVTMTNGLKVIYQRNNSYFVSTDTTKTVGVPTPFYDLPVLYACQKYAKQNSMTAKARELDAEVQKREKDLENYYHKRWKEVKQIIKPKFRNPQ